MTCHGPQQVGSPNVRYAGSLLKYSFSEANQKKGVVIVDLDQAGKAATSAIPLVPRRDVRILKGSFDEIMAAADDRCDDFVLARLTDAAPILDGMAKLRRKYPHGCRKRTRSGGRFFNGHGGWEQASSGAVRAGRNRKDLGLPDGTDYAPGAEEAGHQA